MKIEKKYNSKIIKKRIILGNRITRGMYDYIRRNSEEFDDLVFIKRKIINKVKK